MITIIAALTNDRVIGNAGRLPWDLPEDLRHFQRATRDAIVIMGKTTFLSIGRPLAHRVNIVVSTTLEPREGISVHSMFEDALAYARTLGKEIFIIGGARIYAAALPYADRMLLTHIKGTYEGDTHFPAYDAHEWREIRRETHDGFDIAEYTRTPRS